MSNTRKSTNKYIINECYKPSEEFPAGRLPTLKQVIERCLFFKDYKTSDVQGTVSKELFELWVACNVYPVSVHAIKNKLNIQVKEFSRLLNYDKKKRNLAKYQTDAQKFIEDGSNLFDIFQTDPKLLAKTEKAYLLKMLDEDYRFYGVSTYLFKNSFFYLGKTQLIEMQLSNCIKIINLHSVKVL